MAAERAAPIGPTRRVERDGRAARTTTTPNALVFRGTSNFALPVMVCPGIPAAFKDGDQLEFIIDSGVVKNLTGGKQLTVEALPPNIQHILKSSGLVEVTKEKLAKRAAA